ncbi:hypothetical protein FRB99_004237 [Tulasnella sp. 403]|nr:hypothetical protein FRB99_004237 [Tulasnella sp. 403]
MGRLNSEEADDLEGHGDSESTGLMARQYDEHNERLRARYHEHHELQPDEKSGNPDRDSPRRTGRYLPSHTSLVLLSVIFVLCTIIVWQTSIAHSVTPEPITSHHHQLSFVGNPHARSCLCPETPTGRRVCGMYPPAALKRSQTHLGTGQRVKQVITKFQRDRANGSDRRLRVGIMGGSVSACHGVAEHGDMMGPQCYGRILGDWLNERLGGGPAGGGQVVDVQNGAIGGMDASYYAFCGTNHVDPDVDIVILEFDANDQPNQEFVLYFDQLVRVVLAFPSNPAIVILGTWGPLLGHDLGFLTPAWPHLPVALYYDLPYISLLPLISNTYLRFPHSVAGAFFRDDDIHPSAQGHKLLADLMIGYIEGMLCQIDQDEYDALYDQQKWSETENWIGGGAYTLDKAVSFSSLVGRQTFAPLTAGQDPVTENTYDFLSLPHAASVPILPLPNPWSIYNVDQHADDPDSWDYLYKHAKLNPKPFCADANDKNHPLKPRPDSNGWTTMVWRHEKHFWVSDKVGSKLVVDISVNEGRVAVSYLRSATLTPGVAECWVDDNRRGAKRLEGYWEGIRNVPVVEYIDAMVTPGNHYVTCEVRAQMEIVEMERD